MRHVASPNDDFSVITDRRLIDILHDRGYVLTKKGNVGHAAFHACESRGTWRALTDDTQQHFERSIKASIGAGIGRALLANALIKIERVEDVEHDEITWRGTITAILPE